MTDTNLVGRVGESAVAAQLAAAGFCVFVPVFCSPSTDLIAQYGEKLIRIQVKTADGSDFRLRFYTSANDHKSYVGAVDWLALYSPFHGVTAFLKPEELGVYPVLRYDKANPKRRVNRSVRFAEDYPLDRVIKETMI